MKVTIGKLDQQSGEVPLVIAIDGKKYTRTMRAVLKGDGTLDAAATKTRADEVARGYPAKIAAGVVTPA